MDDHDLAAKLLQNHLTARAALIALPLVRMWSNIGHNSPGSLTMKHFVLAVAAFFLNGGSFVHGQTCASAVTIARDSEYVSDTTGTTDWMSQFGPLSSGGSNDMLYTFVAGAQPLGTITPTAASYTFAMYLIPSCSDTGSEPTPIKATATVGSAIDLSTGITTGNQYWLAVTGTAASPGNGTVNFVTSFPVTILSFTVD